MIQRLYIDNQLVDLSDSTKITLNFKSNIFGDISKITASNSQTIQLPKTTRNRRILDNPTAPAYYSQARYKRHDCRYEQDGVELIRGYAVVLDSSNTYEIALYWGTMSKYQSWVDANPSLTEILYGAALQWNETTTATDYDLLVRQGYGFANYNGGATDKKLANIHPSASCAWVLGKISEQHNVTFLFPDAVQAELQTLFMPCLTNNAGEEYWETRTTARGSVLMTSRGSGLINPMALLRMESVTQGSDVILRNVTGDATYFTALEADKIRIRFKDFTTGKYNELSQFVVVVREEASEKEIPFAATTQNGVYGFDISSEVEVKGATSIYFKVNAIETQSNITTTWYVQEFYYKALVKQNTYPCVFDVNANLPDISQLDFVKAICAMYGLFAMPGTEPNSIRFVTLDDVVGKCDEAYDWTDRLLGEAGGDAQEAKFSIGDYAQKNWFRYTEDDTVMVDADYALTINNEALAREKDAIKLPFAPTKGSTIEQYTITYKDGVGEVDINDVKPRIMRLVVINDVATLLFKDLTWDVLLGSHYARYGSMLNEAVVIKEKLRISEYDIKDIDYTKPVYLAQYGRFFGIVSLRVTGRECTAELAVLPTKPTITGVPRTTSIISGGTSNQRSLNALYVRSSKPVATNLTISVTIALPDSNGGYITTQKVVEMEQGTQEVYVDTAIDSNARLIINSITPTADYQNEYVIKNE